MPVLPSVINEFVSHKTVGWDPIYYDVGPDDCLRETDPSDLESGTIVRIEVWVESGNQYVYTERSGLGKPWSVARFGEYPHDQKKVYNLNDVARGIPSGVAEVNIHPLVRESFRFLHE